MSKNFTSSSRTPPSSHGTFWLYGIHAVKEALLNPQRHCSRLLLSQEGLLEQVVIEKAKKLHSSLTIEKAERDNFLRLFGPHAVHQGAALLVKALEEKGLEDLDLSAPACYVLVLDQITDPQNIGAILRSAAAFKASAAIVPDQNTPPQSNPALAKAASGALEHIPVIRVSNLSRALETLKKWGFWCMGLDETGETTLEKAPLDGKIALVLGAEGKGLRRLTRETCDFLVKLPTCPDFPTLNVSNAAAITLYEVSKKHLS
jgi:23S rRNA (guanosine2251-2'-O)-methyltransferase